jgi:hypothetical protein
LKKNITGDKMSEVKRYIQDLKVAFEFLDKRGFEK